MIKSRDLKKGEQMTLETKIESSVRELIAQQEKINKELEIINNLHAEILAAMIKGKK